MPFLVEYIGNIYHFFFYKNIGKFFNVKGISINFFSFFPFYFAEQSQLNYYSSLPDVFIKM